MNDELQRIAAEFPHPLVFATVSGAHLYGFASADSDVDLRGCHVLPPRDVVGLREPDETEERMDEENGLELDLVSHDVRKFCRLLLRPNGYVLEQLLSPLVIVTSPAHDTMRAAVPRLVTRHHAHHYLGFGQNQWKLFQKEPRVKTLLYVYRVLLTGIHLMRSGKIESSLPALLSLHPVDGVEELLDLKRNGAEKQPLPAAEVEAHRPRYEELLSTLEAARDATSLPEKPTAFGELNELVVDLRTGGLNASSLAPSPPA